MDNNVKIRLKLRYAARLIAGIIFAFLFIQYIFDISHAQKIPRPITFTPHPNARDYYLSAYDQLSNIYGINQLKLTKNDYIKTGASIQQHTDGFNLLKQGLSCQFAETPRSSLIIYDSNTTNQFKYRKLAQILALKSEIEERNKQYKISAESASQAIELGVSISNNTDYYNYTYGIRCQNEGRKRLVRLIHLMDLHTCRDEITILQKVQQSQPTLCDVLENEKQWQLYRIYKSVPDYYGGVYSYFNREEITWYYGSITVPGGKRYLDPQILLISKKRFMNDYRFAMDAYIQSSRSLSYSHPNITQVNNATEGFLLLNYEELITNELKNRLSNSLLLYQISLRAYYLEHHCYPKNLAELSPDYVKEKKGDIVDAATRSHYKITKDGYSISNDPKDGKDHSGSIIVDASDKKSFVFDIVYNGIM